MRTAQLQLSNQIAELDKLRDFMEETIMGQWGVPAAVAMAVNLALEEAFVNIVHYAFNGEETHKVGFLFQGDQEQLLITITDQGRAFDPTQSKAPDTSLPASERPIGGLGILMINKIMDRVEYKRRDDTNELTLTKRIKQ